MTDPNLWNSLQWFWRGPSLPDLSNSSGTSYIILRQGTQDSPEQLLLWFEVTCFTLTVKIKSSSWGWGGKNNSSGVSRRSVILRCKMYANIRPVFDSSSTMYHKQFIYTLSVTLERFWPSYDCHEHLDNLFNEMTRLNAILMNLCFWLI